MDGKELCTEDELVLANSFAGSGYERVLIAALGVLPWVGGAIAAIASLQGEADQDKKNGLFHRWLGEHEKKLEELEQGFLKLSKRVDEMGDEARARLNSDDFLPLVRRAYRAWDRAESQGKRTMIERLLMNAAGTKLCGDDMVRLFVDWIDRYDETHFRVISTVYQNQQKGISRYGIWRNIGEEEKLPREDSREADLFRMLIHDLSTGRVIRQWRKTDHTGQFLKPPRKPRASKGQASPYMKSSFDDEEQYVLSELGAAFVHYVLNDPVQRVG